MIDMGFLKVVRTWALRDKMPIREIARRTGIARNTIKKYLREGIVEPAFQTPDRPSKLDPYGSCPAAWCSSPVAKPPALRFHMAGGGGGFAGGHR